MDATDLLQALRAEQFDVTTTPAGLRVAPANRLTESLREAIRAHKGELLRLLARTCKDCANRAKHGNCTEPEAAGLWPRFILTWAPPGHAQHCAAYRACESITY